MQLARVRKRQGLTQRELAEKVGVSRGLIAQVESGDRRAYGSLRTRIANVLGVRESKIFK